MTKGFSGATKLYDLLKMLYVNPWLISTSDKSDIGSGKD